ncbi:MAG: hypothetical protein LBK44_00045 [Spirochaetales bacterium]|nr:hypothetical protein [Spirochaetales bacterium]
MQKSAPGDTRDFAFGKNASRRYPPPELPCGNSGKTSRAAVMFLVAALGSF